jgi:sec-independent protein translocase protein TatA
VLLVIVLIIFGAGKLPNVMGDLGRGVKEFKKAQVDEDGSRPAAPAAAAPGGPVSVKSEAAPAPVPTDLPAGSARPPA